MPTKDDYRGVDGLIRAIVDIARKQVPIQTVWATAKEIDRDTNYMTATDVLSDLDYFEVSLGLGSVVTFPKVGSKCLLGLIQNHNANVFLIYAEEADGYLVKTEKDVEIKSDKIVFNEGLSSMVKAQELQLQLAKNNLILQGILSAFISYQPPLTPDAGASATAFITGLKGVLAPLLPGDFSNIGNDKIKH